MSRLANAVLLAGSAVFGLTQTGCSRLDMQDQPMNGGVVASLVGFANRAKAVTWKTNRISAYWLPWLSHQAVQLDIGNGADYFFTSEINGCQFRIARTGVNTLRFVHVAGDGPNSALPAGSAWRNGLAQASFTPAQYGLSRALSSSSLLGVPAPNGTVGYGGGHSWTNVFGFRHWHVIGPATWDIWYQTVAPIGWVGQGYAPAAHFLCTL